jgi:hypothetical protein
MGAGRVQEGLLAFPVHNLDNTDPAAAVRRQGFHVANRGDVNPNLPGGLKNGGPRFHGDGFPIDGQIHLSYLHDLPSY